MDDWNRFAANIANGRTYSEKFVKLTNNISVTQKVGTVSGSTQQNAFSGTFDGGGHTITANIEDTSNQGTALFSYINGATIKNLNVSGTISGTQHAAAIVGFSKGTCSIQNCKATATIGGGTHIGGIVGHALDSNISLSGCVFSGLMTGGTTAKGALVGWGDSGTRTLSDCLYVMADGQNTSNLDLVKGSGSVSVSGCYKTTSAGSQGLQVTLAVSENEIYKSLTVAGNSVYLPCTVSGVDTEYYSAVNITPVVKGEGNTNLTLGTDFTATLNGNAITSFPISISTSGNYTLVLTGTGSILGSKSFSITVVTSLQGEGTVESPYIIQTDNDWLIFANIVNSGNDYSDKYVRLEANINISKSVGVKDSHPFSGTFLGNNKTVNASLADDGSQGLAPFRYISNATIKDLTVSGEIGTNKAQQSHAAGLVGFAAGTNLIEGCTVTAFLWLRYDYAGGILGHGLTSHTTIRNCIFAGSIRGTDGSMSHMAGIWGWNDSGATAILENCIEAAQMIYAYAFHPIGLYAGSNGTITNCYYTDSQMNSPDHAWNASGAHRAYKSVPDNEICKIVTLRNTTVYSPCPVSGIEENYEGVNFNITPVVKDVNTDNDLTLGTDYMVTLNATAWNAYPISITEKNDYTLAFTGKDGSNYTGTKNIKFTVGGQFEGSGDTANDPVKIESRADWNTFATNVNGGNSYSGKFIKLTNNISVSTMVGTVSGNTRDKFFSGTFDGDGHTITVSYDDQQNQGVAPFRYIKDATIKNLTTAGSTMSNRSHASGLVGFAEGTNQIEDCTVTVELRHNDQCDIIGGIIGHGLNSTTTLKGCVFEGRFVGLTFYHAVAGALWGWNDDGTNPILIDCMERGSYDRVNAYHPVGNQGSAGTITNCYYINSVYDRQYGAQYGKFCTVKGAYQVVASLPEDKLSKIINYKNTTYYQPYTDYSRNHYPYTGSDIDIYLEMVNADGDPCVKGTDYTCTIHPETVKEVGNYTLTITGNGTTFTGTTVIPFTVTNCLLNSKFTVNASGSQVQFSQGNLQATTIDQGATWIWDFATRQQDYIGNTQANKDCTNYGPVDLFGWVGASSAFIGGAQYGISSSTNNADYGIVANEALKMDWGNTIAPGYRILTTDEWDYLFNTRETGTTVIGFENARYTHAQVGDVKGVILFPEGINIINTEANSWGAINAPGNWGTQCTTSQWEALAAKGCVFLPAAGKRFNEFYRWHDSNQWYEEWRLAVSSDEGYYWASTSSTGETTAYAMYMAPGQLNPRNSTDRYCGRSVRLVKDYVAPHVNSYAIADGDTYTATEDFTAGTATYTKTVSATKAHMAWFVPFDYTITEADLEKFKFWKINMIANAPNPQTDATDEVWMFLKPMQEGDVLHANMPYVYWALEAVDGYEFTTADAVLKAKADGAVVTMQTMEDTYNLYGTYGPTSPSISDPFYYMNSVGEQCLGNNGSVSVRAFRWIIRKTSKYGNTTSYAPRIIIFDGESDVTGISQIEDDNLRMENEAGAWYSLDGRKLNGKPSRAGIYINNGRKVVIK